MPGFTWIAGILSFLVGGIALFNLARKTFDIGLYGVALDAVEYYQRIFYPIIDLIKQHADWLLPDWNKDFIMLVVFVVATNARSLAHHFFVHSIDAEAEREAPISISAFESIKGGVIAPFIFLTGGDFTLRRRLENPSLAIATATVFLFLFMVTLTLFIPYVRAVFSFLAVMTAVLFVGMMLKLIEWKADFVNKKVFMLHYWGAILGTLAFFALNLYGP